MGKHWGACSKADTDLTADGQKQGQLFKPMRKARLKQGTFQARLTMGITMYDNIETYV